MTKKKITGTPYDNVFKTLLEKCSQLIIPVINEVFHTEYDINEEITLLSNEFHYIPKKGKSYERITDSCIRICSRMYHIECQSNADFTMEIRMIEYDFFLGLSNIEQYDSQNYIKFPESAVLYLRHTVNTPDEIKVNLILPGGKTADYNIPVVKIQNYNKDEIFDKNPAQLYNFRKEFEDIYNHLNSLNARHIIDINYLNNLIQLTVYLTDIVTAKTNKIKREVDIMRGKVLRFETDDIWDEALEKGRKEGEQLKLISKIRIKLSKNKTPQMIADELEEPLPYINQIIDIMKDETLSDADVFKYLSD
ncbi:MAG: hypothetical protein K2N34_02825 [Lachnospiraceae bacterium]|nr:hypothetical protein [Lachnospiraceae bacterium]